MFLWFKKIWMAIRKIFDWVDDSKEKYRCYFNGQHVKNNGSDFSRMDKAQAFLQNYAFDAIKNNPNLEITSIYVQPPKSKGKFDMSYLFQNIGNGNEPTEELIFALAGEAYAVRSQTATETATQTYFNKDWMFSYRQSNDVNDMGEWIDYAGAAGTDEVPYFRHSFTFTSKYYQIKAREVGNLTNEIIQPVQDNALFDDVAPKAGTLTHSTPTYNSTTISLSPTDNTVVEEIDIYINDDFNQTVTAASLSDFLLIGLSPETSYSIYCVPRDANGNEAQSNAISFTTPTAGGAGVYPKILNLRIDDNAKTKVKFDSNVIITATDFVGFNIYGKTITGITINTGQLTDHEFTVSSAFDFWSNNNLRYEGGSNMKDGNNFPVLPFTLSYIKNNIVEPVSTEDR